MKDKIVKIVINALIGALSSIAAIYIGGGAAEAVIAGGLTSGVIGERVSSVVTSVFA